MTTDDDRPGATGPSTLDVLLREVARAEPRTPPRKAPPSLVGEVLDGKYRVDSLLGEGGMGTVYVATHVGTGRQVAFKVLRPELTANEAAVERFRREARASGQMRHPNVVDVTDFGFAQQGDERLAYLVMELLRGKTLRAVLDAEGALPLAVAVDVIEQVSAAVAEAHRLGILHRDLKPENIHLELVARGYRVKVLDFGIAKLLSVGEDAADTSSVGVGPPMPSALATTMPAEGPSLTRAGAAMGTPQYMSPEQWRGEAIDERADIYSLGVVAYEMLAGEPPFSGKDRWIALEHAEATLPSLVSKAPGIPRRIASAVEAALAKDPAARPPSATALAASLRAATETTFTLLRRSIGLSTDHYALLARRCLMLTVPPVILSGLGPVGAWLVRAGLVSAGVGSAIASGGAAAGAALSIFLSMPIGGLLVPLVAHLGASRGSPRPPPPPVAEVAQTLWQSIPSTLAVVGLALVSATAGIPLVLLARAHGLQHDGFLTAPIAVVVMSAVTAWFAVYGAVGAVEHVGGLQPLRRSMTLLRSMWRAAFGVTVFYGALTQALPAVGLLVLEDVIGKPAHPSSGALGLGPLLLNLCNGLLMPYVLVPVALLYLRAREAEGAQAG